MSDLLIHDLCPIDSDHRDSVTIAIDDLTLNQIKWVLFALGKWFDNYTDLRLLPNTRWSPFFVTDSAVTRHEQIIKEKLVIEIKRLLTSRDLCTPTHVMIPTDSIIKSTLSRYKSNNMSLADKVMGGLLILGIAQLIVTFLKI